MPGGVAPKPPGANGLDPQLRAARVRMRTQTETDMNMTNASGQVVTMLGHIGGWIISTSDPNRRNPYLIAITDGHIGRRWLSARDSPALCCHVWDALVGSA